MLFLRKIAIFALRITGRRVGDGPGEMPEWSIGPHSKCGVRATVPGVRIPLSPQRINRSEGWFFFLIRGKVQEWLNWPAWKASKPLKGFRGSNPLLSARGVKHASPAKPKSADYFCGLDAQFRINSVARQIKSSPLPATFCLPAAAGQAGRQGKGAAPAGAQVDLREYRLHLRFWPQNSVRKDSVRIFLQRICHPDSRSRYSRNTRAWFSSAFLEA